MNKRQRKKLRKSPLPVVMSLGGYEFTIVKTRIRKCVPIRGKMKRWYKRHPFVEEPINVGLGAWLDEVPKT